MQRTILISFLLFWGNIYIQAQSPILGVWKTIDDITGKAKSHVEIFEKNGQYYGKLMRLLQSPENSVCEACPGDKKDKPLIGMEIIWGMKPYKNYWSSGRIMDPENGKTYKCNLTLKQDGKLEVRGYVGFSALGRSQYWHRVDQ